MTNESCISSNFSGLVLSIRSTSKQVTSHFNAIFSNDFEREIIRSTQLQKSDKIMVKGKLKYDKVNNVDGRKFPAGSILGNSIVKLNLSSNEQNALNSPSIESHWVNSSTNGESDNYDDIIKIAEFYFMYRSRMATPFFSYELFTFYNKSIVNSIISQSRAGTLIFGSNLSDEQEVLLW